METKVNIEVFLQSGAIISDDSGSCLVGYGRPVWKTFKELDLQQPAFYFPNFFLEKDKPWVQYPYMAKIRSHEELIWEDLSIAELPEWSKPDQKLFQECFVDLKQRIQSRQLQKGVPYLFTTTPTQMTHARLHRSLLHALRRWQSGTSHLYGYWESGQGVLGLTPELLFTYDQGCQRVQTMALAGTCPKGLKNSFGQNAKEQHEHALVVEGIKQHLQPFGSVSIGQMQVLELPRLCHLLTPIEVQLNRFVSFEELVQSLHPTPALGAFPKEAGHQWLQYWNQHLPRGYYGAPAGFIDLSTGVMKCLVAIRQVQWNQKGMRIGAGCGVVSQSELDQEWAEIHLKLQAIRENLDL